MNHLRRCRRRLDTTTAAISILWLLLVRATVNFGFVYPPLTHRISGRSLAFSVSPPLVKPAKTSGLPRSFRLTTSYPTGSRRWTTHLTLANGEDIGSFYMLLSEGGFVAAIAGATSMLISILAYSLLAIAQRPLELGRNREQLDRSKQDFLTKQAQAKNLSLLALGLAISGFLSTAPVTNTMVKSGTAYERKSITTLISEHTRSSTEFPNVALQGDIAPVKSSSSVSSVPSQISESLTETSVEPNSSESPVEAEGTPSLDIATAMPFTKSEPPSHSLAKSPTPVPLKDVPKEEQSAEISPLPSQILDKSEIVVPKEEVSESSSDLSERPSETSSATPAAITKTSALSNNAQSDDSSSLAPPYTIPNLPSQSTKMSMESPPVIKSLEQSSAPSLSKEDVSTVIEPPKTLSPLAQSSDGAKRELTEEQQSNLSENPIDTLSARLTESETPSPLNQNSSPQDKADAKTTSPDLSKDASTITQPSKIPASPEPNAPVPTLTTDSSPEQGRLPSTPSSVGVIPDLSKLFAYSLGKFDQNLVLGTGVTIGSILLSQGFLWRKGEVAKKKVDRKKTQDATGDENAPSSASNLIESVNSGLGPTGCSDDLSVANNTLQAKHPLDTVLQMEKQQGADVCLDTKATNPNMTTIADVEIVRDRVGVPFFYDLYHAPLGKEVDVTKSKDLVADVSNATVDVDENNQDSLSYWWEEGISGKNLTQVVLGTKSPVLDSFSFPVAMPKEIRRQLILAKYGVNNTKSSARLPVTVRNLTGRRLNTGNKANQNRALSEPVRNVAESWLVVPEPTLTPPPQSPALTKEISSLRPREIKKLAKVINAAIKNDEKYAARKANNSTDVFLQIESAEADKSYKRVLQSLSSRNESERTDLKP